MFQELGIAVRVFYTVPIFFIMILKGKTGMVAGLVYLLKISHQSILTMDIQGCFEGEEFFKLTVVEAQQFIDTIFAAFKPFNIGVYGIARDAQGLGDFRSEERRVGKEWKSWGSPEHQKKDIYT